MPKINVLDSSVYNRISAGEVVERPRSVVKELVENSIDAGATQINVTIEGGGIKYICVSDNGSGIKREDIKNAFLPHATSKVATIDDLDKISTLGFRGEALASIASVAQVTVKSKTSDSSSATLYEINGGVEGDVSECALNAGTTIEVKNLFFNTPVRAKFLKKPKSEENEITALMKEFILTNPDTVFVYKVDGKIVFQNSGNSMEDALYAVYRRDIVDHFIPFESSVDDIRVYGYVASPEISKPTRSYQTIIVNGRFIKDSNISMAVQTAFGERLMKRSFPVFIVNLIVPFDDVDVNVHPSKTEVRFRDPRHIFSVVYHAIALAIASGETIFSLSNPKVTVTEPIELATTVDSTPITAQSVTTHVDDIDSSTDSARDSITREEDRSDSLVTDDEPITFEALTGGHTYNNSSINRLRTAPSSVRESTGSGATSSTTQFSFIDDGIDDDVDTIASGSISMMDFRIVGQIFNAFLLVEYKGDLLLMDQHACHERLLYDKLISEIDGKKLNRQQLLLPYILNVSPEDDDFVRDNIDTLDSMGFSVSELREYQYRVDSVPEVLGHINLAVFFNDFLSEKNKYRQLKFIDLIHNRIATTACKAAIKAGNILSDEQIKMLLDIFTKNGDLPLQCPHGRPAVIRITRKDIDKLFKRIV